MSNNILEDYTRDQADTGSPSRPFHVRFNHPVDPISTISDEIRQWSPFKGRWQTILSGTELMVPDEYKELLQFGGVVTTGPDVHLMIFGKKHWERMEMLISKQLGFDPNQVDVMRHIYMHHSEFDGLTLDEKGNASITLSDELIRYARLKEGHDAKNRGFVIMVGLIYYAEIHDQDHYNALQMSPEEVRGLVASLS